jgi:uncharacterized protein YjdB
MKKVLLVLAVLPLLFAGCSKDDESEKDVIKLNDSDVVLFVGDVKLLKYNITPETSANKNLSWSSSNSDIVYVDNSGNITALKTGESVITVEIVESNVKSTCKVTVNPKKVEGISLNESEISIVRGDIVQLDYTIIPETSSNKNVIWTSSDENIAGVDNNGSVTAKAVGNCTVTVKTEDGGFEASCKVTVTPVPVDEITVEGLYLDNPSGSQFPQSNYDNLFLCHGDRLKVKINFNPQDADNQNLIWESSDENLATVSGEGILSITSDTQKTGFVTITAVSEDGGHTATLGINVDDVHLKAQGMSWQQVGGSNIVTFISRIATSIEKSITIGSIYIASSDDQLIQIVSNMTNSYNTVTAISNPMDVGYLGLSGQNLTNFLSTWKFVYTYKLPGMNDFVTKEVFINASVWNSTI